MAIDARLADPRRGALLRVGTMPKMIDVRDPSEEERASRHVYYVGFRPGIPLGKRTAWRLGSRLTTRKAIAQR